MVQNPATVETQVVRRVSIPLDENLTGIRRTVLLVAPDADFRAAAARALTLAGYQVVQAAHSGHAMLAALTVGRVDVLAADLAMDDLSGPALAERLRRHHGGLQTLYFGNPGTPQCDGILVRPFTRDELLGGIRTLA